MEIDKEKVTVIFDAEEVSSLRAIASIKTKGKLSETIRHACRIYVKTYNANAARRSKTD